MYYIVYCILAIIRHAMLFLNAVIDSDSSGFAFKLGSKTFMRVE